MAAPFTCDGEIYQVQSGQLRIFDTALSSYVDVGAQNSSYNATGFNIQDNYAYGIQGQDIIQISDDGSIIDVFPNIGFSSFAGDVDANNTLWLRRNASRYDGVDLSTGAITTINFTGSTQGAADVAYIQDSGTNYLVAPSTNNVGLLNLDNGTSTTKPITGMPSGAFGASWTDFNGRLFTFSNTSGEIFEIFDLFDNSVTTATAVLVAQGDPSGSNDGFSCTNEAFPNLPPLAFDDDFVTGVDVPVSVDVLVDNGNGADSEPDGQVITVNSTPVSGPSSGSVVFNADFTFTYTPNPGFFGVDSFDYIITDPFGLTATATVTITIEPPTLTIVKEVINDGQGALVVGDFGLSVGSVAALTFDAGVVSGNTTTYTSSEIELIPGNYALSENDISAYAEGTWSCSGAAGAVVTAFDNGSVEIANGEDVICTISNDDINADLAIEKTFLPANPNIGDTVTFQLVVSNNGPDDATAVVVDDTVLAGFTFQTGTMTGGDNQIEVSASSLQWEIDNLANGASVTLTYEVIVN